MKYNFKGFTEKANLALNLAIEAAEEMGHTYIGSEHILLGLCRENSGVAYAALSDSGVTADKLDELIRSASGEGSAPTSLSPEDFTPRTKRVMQNAVMMKSMIVCTQEPHLMADSTIFSPVSASRRNSPVVASVLYFRTVIQPSRSPVFTQ